VGDESASRADARFRRFYEACFDQVAGYLLARADKDEAAEAVARTFEVAWHATVACDDILTRFVSSCEEVRVVLRAGVGPGVRLAYRPAEDRSEVANLDTCQMLNQPQEVGARRDERPSDVMLREAVQLPHDGIAGGLQSCGVSFINSDHTQESDAATIG
jgi:hypothetical protein